MYHIEYGRRVFLPTFGQPQWLSILRYMQVYILLLPLNWRITYNISKGKKPTCFGCNKTQYDILFIQIAIINISIRYNFKQYDRDGVRIDGFVPTDCPKLQSQDI